MFQKTMTSNTSTQTCEIDSSGSKVLPINLILLCFTNVTFFAAGTFLNGLVLCTFVRSSLLRSKTSFYLVAVMSAADLLVVTVVHPLSVMYFYSEIEQNDAICKYEMFYNILRHLLCSISSYMLLLMGAERFIAVCCPFYYQRFMTKCKLSWCVALVCLTILGLWLLSVEVTSTKEIVVIAELIFLFLVTGVIYTTLYMIARKKRRHNNISQSRDLREQRQHFLQNIKLSSVYVLVTMTFTVCFCPTLVVYILQYFVKPSDSSYPIFHIFRLWARTFLPMNSTFNCCIYFWKNSTLRKEAKKIFGTTTH